MSLYIDLAPENATPAVKFSYANPKTRKCLIALILCIKKTFHEHVPSELWNHILDYCDIKEESNTDIRLDGREYNFGKSPNLETQSDAHVY